VNVQNTVDCFAFKKCVCNRAVRMSVSAVGFTGVCQVVSSVSTLQGVVTAGSRNANRTTQAFKTWR
jgi:hypothetical protein